MTLKKRNGKKMSVPNSVKKHFPDVKYVIDASKDIEVSVNSKDCKDAKKFDPKDCAMARAAKRELHADGAIIGLSTSYIVKGDSAIRYGTPARVQREIVSFDRHSDFAPGEYYLKPKSPTSQLGKYKKHYTPENPGGAGIVKHRKIHKSARVRILPTGQSGE